LNEAHGANATASERLLVLCRPELEARGRDHHHRVRFLAMPAQKPQPLSIMPQTHQSSFSPPRSEWARGCSDKLTRIAYACMHAARYMHARHDFFARGERPRRCAFRRPPGRSSPDILEPLVAGHTQAVAMILTHTFGYAQQSLHTGVTPNKNLN
jgi:hypothetical protein